MLIIYKLLIDTERLDLQDDPSIGFQGGIYHFSTVRLNGFHDCFDGDSFSEISQQNAILKGGELSLMEDVQIKIVSKKVLSHIMRYEIDLLGSRVSMSIAIGDADKTVFENMLVSAYPQLDEISLEITLKDAAFAKAELANLKIPQGFGGKSQLETSYGEECLLKLYRQNVPGEPISQGVRRVQTDFTQELEQQMRNFPLFTARGRPTFTQNFTLRRVLNAGSGRPAEVIAPFYHSEDSWLGPELFGVVGRYIEICAGKGKGNVYRITRVHTQENVAGPIITLDRPVEDGEILDPEIAEAMGLGRIPVAMKYSYNQDDNTTSIKNPIRRFYKSSTWDIHLLDDIIEEGNPVFRFVDATNKYAVPRLIKEIEPIQNLDGYRAKVTQADGSFSDAVVNLNLLEAKDRYLIYEFPTSPQGKTNLTRVGEHQPRWKIEHRNTAVRAYYPDSQTGLGAQLLYVGMPSEGAEVPRDSEDFSTQLPLAIQVDTGRLVVGAGVDASIYWRIDDLPHDAKCKIRIRFSFEIGFNANIALRALLVDDVGTVIEAKNYNIRADEDRNPVDDRMLYAPGTKISLTHNKTTSSYPSTPTPELDDLLIKLRNLLVFNYNGNAKYIYLQMFFGGPMHDNSSIEALRFAALPVAYEQEIDVDAMQLIGRDVRDATGQNRDIARRTKQLCLDCGIKVDEQSFNDVGDKILSVNSNHENSIPFIPFVHGDKFIDKLAEICRAANFSIYSDGSRLRAKYFFDSSSEELAITSREVIKGSVTVRPAAFNSIATEWNFSANTWGGAKTLSLEATEEFPGGDWQVSGRGFVGSLSHVEYITERNMPSFGIWFPRYSGPGDIIDSIRVGSKYRIDLSSGTRIGVCILSSLRISEDRYEMLFSADSLHSVQPLSAVPNGANISAVPLMQEPQWREAVSGTLDIDESSAHDLWDISNKAFSKTKRRAKLDERYTRHQIAAFGNDESWLENFLKVAEYNAFAKTIVSFKVPINCLPGESLASMLLKRVVLKFERFRSNNLEGWIIGYSLIPTENVVQIEVVNAQPIKNILWLDENILENQLVVNEVDVAAEVYSEA